MIDKAEIRLGYVPLVDCAPLVVAQELGYYKEEGLQVELSCEASWATIRDKVAMGSLDGAQMIAGMPIATRVGICAVNQAMLTAFSISLNGNAITLSNQLYSQISEQAGEGVSDSLSQLKALKSVIQQRRERGQPPLRFAVVFPVSSHNYQLRYWLASIGIDPDIDVEIRVIPPPQMVETLKDGLIDGFCVGEPWNTQAVEEGIGQCIITGYEIWNNAPEKVFGVTQSWADANPQTHHAVIRALYKAGQWLDDSANRSTAAEILSDKGYINLSRSILDASLQGSLLPGGISEDLNVFHRYGANFPWRSHAIWFITQMYRWGQIDHAVNMLDAAQKAYRPDILREALQEIEPVLPYQDMKSEGLHSENWQLPGQQRSLEMGPDRFIDNKVYEPENAIEYLQSFSVEHCQISFDLLTAS